MKTRINLYVAKLRPVKEKLALATSLTIIASVACLIIAIVGGVYWLNYAELQHQQQLNATLVQEQQQLAKQAMILGEINNNHQLLKQIETVKQHIKNKKRILVALNDHLERDTGFTKLLLALAQVSDSNVWLTHITSEQGLLTLSGSARRSDDIPKWVNRLNQAELLKGHVFSGLELARDNDVVNFVLNNQSGDNVPQAAP